MGWGEGKTYRGEGGRKLLSVGGLLVRFCPPRFFAPPPPLAFSGSGRIANGYFRNGSQCEERERETHTFQRIGKFFVFVRGVRILKVPVCKVPVCELLRLMCIFVSTLAGVSVGQISLSPALCFLSWTGSGKRVYTTTVAPLFSRSLARPRGHIRADFREGGEDSNFSVFRVRAVQ